MTGGYRDAQPTQQRAPRQAKAQRVGLRPGLALPGGFRRLPPGGGSAGSSARRPGAGRRGPRRRGARRGRSAGGPPAPTPASAPLSGDAVRAVRSTRPRGGRSGGRCLASAAPVGRDRGSGEELDRHAPTTGRPGAPSRRRRPMPEPLIPVPVFLRPGGCSRTRARPPRTTPRRAPAGAAVPPPPRAGCRGARGRGPPSRRAGRGPGGRPGRGHRRPRHPPAPAQPPAGRRAGPRRAGAERTNRHATGVRASAGLTIALRPPALRRRPWTTGSSRRRTRSCPRGRRPRPWPRRGG